MHLHSRTRRVHLFDQPTTNSPSHTQTKCTAHNKNPARHDALVFHSSSSGRSLLPSGISTYIHQHLETTCIQNFPPIFRCWYLCLHCRHRITKGSPCLGRNCQMYPFGCKARDERKSERFGKWCEKDTAMVQSVRTSESIASHFFPPRLLAQRTIVVAERQYPFVGLESRAHRTKSCYTTIQKFARFGTWLAGIGFGTDRNSAQFHSWTACVR